MCRTASSIRRTIDERAISDRLYTAGMPDPDLLDPDGRRDAGEQFFALAN